MTAERITQRRAELAAEYERGQATLAQMEQERARLEQTLLRISGAILVFEELLTQPPAGEMDGEHGDNS